MHSYVTLGEGAPRGVGVIFDAPLRGIGTPGGVSGKRAASESGAAKSLKSEAFGVIFDAPLRGIGRPGGVFWTKFRSGF